MSNLFRIVCIVVLLFLIHSCKKSDDNTIKDADGNVYTSVTIGTQVWMVENLKTTKYSDGEAMTQVTDNIAWNALKTPAYCWYNNDETTYKPDYGALYNKYAAYSSRLCPTGWHVPSLTDWEVLGNYLGGIDVAGGKMKEVGTTHWQSPNIATNESSFTALPGGIRNLWDDGTSFRDINTGGHWWNSSMPSDIYNSSDWVHLQNNFTTLPFYRGANTEVIGMSIRCIKN